MQVYITTQKTTIIHKILASLHFGPYYPAFFFAAAPEYFFLVAGSVPFFFVDCSVAFLLADGLDTLPDLVAVVGGIGLPEDCKIKPGI